MSQVESTKVDNIKVRITDKVQIPFLNSNKVITAAVSALQHRYWLRLHSVCSPLPACSLLEYRRHLLLSFALGWPLACSLQGSNLCEAFVAATLTAAPTRCLLSPGLSAYFLRGSRGSWAAI